MDQALHTKQRGSFGQSARLHWASASFSGNTFRFWFKPDNGGYALFGGSTSVWYSSPQHSRQDVTHITVSDSRNYEIRPFDFSSNIHLENLEIDATRRKYSACLVSTLRTITSPNLVAIRLHLNTENYDSPAKRKDELCRIVTQIYTISSLRCVKIDLYSPLEHIVRIYVQSGSRGLLGNPFVEKIKDMQNREVLVAVFFPEHGISVRH